MVNNSLITKVVFHQKEEKTTPILRMWLASWECMETHQSPLYHLSSQSALLWMRIYLCIYWSCACDRVRQEHARLGYYSVSWNCATFIPFPSKALTLKSRPIIAWTSYFPLTFSLLVPVPFITLLCCFWAHDCVSFCQSRQLILNMKLHSYVFMRRPNTRIFTLLTQASSTNFMLTVPQLLPFFLPITFCFFPPPHHHFLSQFSTPWLRSSVLFLLL